MSFVDCDRCAGSGWELVADHEDEPPLAVTCGTCHGEGLVRAEDEGGEVIYGTQL